jgi:vacuolar-type H+-ATPase subunit I/STV1
VNTENALDALTDIALFIAVYVGVLSTVFAVGEPQTRGEVMGRVIALWMCAVAGAVLIVWLVIAILIRLGLIAHVG